MGEVSDYIAGADEPARSMLAGLRDRVLRLVPDAEEGTSYGMPALRYRGRPLISVMATKAGYSLFPFSAEVVAGVIGGLPGFASTKGGIKFADTQPLPDDAFDGIVLARRAEIDAALDRHSDSRG
jgi:uncharacterized protein YdhG (YjbR/CyaY superfamily)